RAAAPGETLIVDTCVAVTDRNAPPCGPLPPAASAFQSATRTSYCGPSAPDTSLAYCSPVIDKAAESPPKKSVPQTMLSANKAVPQTTLKPLSELVPQTTK